MTVRDYVKSLLEMPQGMEIVQYHEGGVYGRPLSPERIKLRRIVGDDEWVWYEALDDGPDVQEKEVVSL